MVLVSAAAMTRLWTWWVLAAILARHLADGSSSPSSSSSASASASSSAAIAALSTELSQLQQALFDAQREFLELQQDHGDLHKAHEVLTKSHDSLRLKHRSLQRRLSTLSMPHGEGPDTASWSVSPPDRHHIAPDDRRVLSASGVCDEFGDAQLVVEGSGVFTDDMIIASGDQQTSVADFVADSDETAYAMDRLHDWLCLPISDALFAQSFQTLDTLNSQDVEYFQLGADMHIIAVATHKNATDDNFNLKSALYRYNDAVSAFEVFQEIDGSGAFDWEHFRIGDDDFLALANLFNGSIAPVPSVVYKYNNVTMQFEVFQEFITDFARAWEHFTIGSDDFIAVANSHNGTSSLMPVVVYRYNVTASVFEQFQEIPSKDARDVRYFNISGEHFIAIANVYDDVSYAQDAVVYRFNHTTSAFEVFQNIPGNAAVALEYFRLSTSHFLVVANYYDPVGKTYALPSVVYQYNATTEAFEVFQEIDTLAATHLEYFHMGDTDFLAVANQRNATSSNVNSVVYRYNNATAAFEPLQDIATSGIAHIEHFVIDDLNFMAFAGLSSTDILLCNDFCF